MKYQASAVRVVWIVWKKTPATMYWIEISVIVSQTDSNQSRTPKPGQVADREHDSDPEEPEGDLDEPARPRTGRGTVSPPATVWWSALMGPRLSRLEDDCSRGIGDV